METTLSALDTRVEITAVSTRVQRTNPCLSSLSQFEVLSEVWGLFVSVPLTEVLIQCLSPKTLLLTWTRTRTHVRSSDTELASYPPISSVRRRHSTMSIYISGRISQTINYPNELKLNPQRRACANTHIKNTPKTRIRTVLNIRRKRNIRSVVRRFQKSVLDRIHVLQIRRAPKMPSILVK